jgi:hypothetical protein
VPPRATLRLRLDRGLLAPGVAGSRAFVLDLQPTTSRDGGVV